MPATVLTLTPLAFPGSYGSGAYGVGLYGESLVIVGLTPTALLLFRIPTIVYPSSTTYPSSGIYPWALVLTLTPVMP